jgi:hypothetical protein
VVGDLAYTTPAGFTWTDSSTLEDRIARFARGGSGGGNGTGAVWTERSGGQRPRKSAGTTGKDRPGVETPVDSAGAGIAAKPFMKLIAQGSKEDYKLLGLRDKLRALQADAQTARNSAAAAVTVPSSSTSPLRTQPSSHLPHTATSSADATQGNKLGFELALRWKFLAKELMKLPQPVLASDAAAEALDACLAVLAQNHHFFTCNLGELDIQWPEFAEVQSVRLNRVDRSSCMPSFTAVCCFGRYRWWEHSTSLLLQRARDESRLEVSFARLFGILSGLYCTIRLLLWRQSQHPMLPSSRMQSTLPSRAKRRDTRSQEERLCWPAAQQSQPRPAVRVRVAETTAMSSLGARWKRDQTPSGPARNNRMSIIQAA